MDADAIFESEVKKRTKKIETLLITKFGANGRGLWEKITSVEKFFPEQTVKRIRFIATVRNKLEHRSDYVFDGDRERLLRTGDECISVLENTDPATSKPNFPNPFNRLTDDFAEVEYKDAKSPAKERKNSLKGFNLSAQPKALRIVAYTIGVIIACSVIIQLGAFASRHYITQSATSQPAAPTPTESFVESQSAKKQKQDVIGTYEEETYSMQFEIYEAAGKVWAMQLKGSGSANELVPVGTDAFTCKCGNLYGEITLVRKNGKVTGLQEKNPYAPSPTLWKKVK